MAICLRTVSNKLTPIKKLVIQVKHITLTPCERQFPALALKSQFLDEFFSPYLANNDILNGCKQNDINSDSVNRCPDLSNSLDGRTNGKNEVSGVAALKRNVGQSSTEQLLQRSDLANAVTHVDPLSFTVKPLTPTPDDIILWTAVSCVEQHSKQGVVDVSCLHCASPRGKEAISSEWEENGEAILDHPKDHPQDPHPDYSKPTAEQLHKVYSVLAETLPELFRKPMDFSIYDHDIVFENNIQGVVTKGLPAYMKQVILLRTIGHFKFAFVKFEILKITKHPDEGTVKIRWRIRGLSGLKFLSQFWKYKLWKVKEIFEAEEAWYDGFSTFYVGANGRVYRHVADKVMPDDDKAAAEKTPPTLIAKLALLVAAASQEGLTEVNSLLTSFLTEI